jgi:hypothetical protein
MRKTILAGAALAVAAVFAITGAATATTSTKTEHFSLIDSSTSASPVYSAIARGEFTAGGTAIGGPGKGAFTLRFPGGTIAVKIKRGHSKLLKVDTASACLQTESGAGTYTLASGTGAYKGIAGSGKATKDLTFVEGPVKGKCAGNFAAVQGIITLSGPVSLP